MSSAKLFELEMSTIGEVDTIRVENPLIGRVRYQRIIDRAKIRGENLLENVGYSYGDHLGLLQRVQLQLLRQEEVITVVEDSQGK
jgi:hypothetical protein